MIAIVDYGVGNLRSVENMLRKVGAECAISSDPDVIKHADKLILPGVGNFGQGMKKLRSKGLLDVLNWFALDVKRPVLGICLGAQILGNGSEEAEGPGLGWIDMQCKRFPYDLNVPVPHMSWNELKIVNESPLFPDNAVGARYYFVHSFYMECSNSKNIVANSHHGIDFTAVVQSNNIFGTQFHPEKSHRFGMDVLRAFDGLKGNYEEV